MQTCGKRLVFFHQVVNGFSIGTSGSFPYFHDARKSTNNQPVYCQRHIPYRYDQPPYQNETTDHAADNGRPCEDRIILKEFAKLREDAGLPKVVFHSLRHSSTTYKLKLNHGDLKATQGDTGHAEIDMITSIYAHILDEDRKVNAQKFETAFYANPDLRSVRPPEEPKEPAPATLDLEALVEQLRNSPELANTLAALLASAPSEK